MSMSSWASRAQKLEKPPPIRKELRCILFGGQLVGKVRCGEFDSVKEGSSPHRHSTFAELPKWTPSLSKDIDQAWFFEHTIFVLVGLKKDRVDRREVLTEEAEHFAEANNMLYYETSAKTGENVREMFTELALKAVALFGLDPPKQKQDEYRPRLFSHDSSCLLL